MFIQSPLFRSFNPDSHPPVCYESNKESILSCFVSSTPFFLRGTTSPPTHPMISPSSQRSFGSPAVWQGPMIFKRFTWRWSSIELMEQHMLNGFILTLPVWMIYLFHWKYRKITGLIWIDMIDSRGTVQDTSQKKSGNSCYQTSKCKGVLLWFPSHLFWEKWE